MNNLLSNSFSGMDLESGLQMASLSSAGSMAPFFEETGAMKASMEEIEALMRSLADAHEESKSLHKAAEVRSLRSRMAQQVKQVLVLARSLKLRLDQLDAANVASRKNKGCEEGSPTDRTRVHMTSTLREKLRKLMDEFNGLRDRLSSEHKETVRRRYFTLTGNDADEETIDHIIETGQSEDFIKRAVQQQGSTGRIQIIDTVQEIQARHDAAKEMERSLLELHQIFLDMGCLVEAQGQQLNSIQVHVERALSFVDHGRGQLEKAKKSQRSSRKWTCIAIILLLIVIVIIVVPIVTTFKKK